MLADMRQTVWCLCRLEPHVGKGVDRQRLIGHLHKETHDLLPRRFLHGVGQQLFPNCRMSGGCIQRWGQQNDVGFGPVGALLHLNETGASWGPVV
ncbi:MAG: hypothetical protein R2851_05130 [Caldilineaceae bacterium]